MRRTQEGYSPFKDDKTKDTENSPFEASSVLVVKAIIPKFDYIIILCYNIIYVTKDKII